MASGQVYKINEKLVVEQNELEREKTNILKFELYVTITNWYIIIQLIVLWAYIWINVEDSNGA